MEITEKAGGKNLGPKILFNICGREFFTTCTMTMTNLFALATYQ